MIEPAPLLRTRSDHAYRAVRERVLSGEIAPRAGRDDATRSRADHEHARLADLVEAGDGEGAAALVRRHVDSGQGAHAAWPLLGDR